MSVNILTPVSLWEGFYIEAPISFRSLVKKTENGVVSEYLRIDGRSVGKEKVNIFALFKKPENFKSGPAVLISSDPEFSVSESFSDRLVKEGYAVLAVDIGGKREDGKPYTVYPDEISFANFLENKDNLFSVKTSVKDTCWYEWGAVLRYAYAFLRSIKGVNRIGAIGVKYGANPLFYLASIEKDVKAFVSILNAGWSSYNGIDAFGETVEPEFSDETCAFVAGAEPQSYASRILCPTLILSALNSKEFKPERAHETSFRIPDEVYSCVNFSVGYEEAVDKQAFSNIVVFLENFLKKKKLTFISEPKLSLEIEGGKIIVNVNANKKDLADVSVYFSEEIKSAEDRTFEMAVKVKEDGLKRVFEYKPYAYSKNVIAFAKARYLNGFEISSPISFKELNPQAFLPSSKNKIMYSGRILGAESVFSANVPAETFIDADGDYAPIVKKGPMDIEGVYSSYGLKTKRVLRLKDAPDKDSILIFDVFSANANTIKVTLTVKNEVEEINYSASVNINGGNVWYNAKLEAVKFKTEEGRILREYKGITSIKIEGMGEYLINNVLWV